MQSENSQPLRPWADLELERQIFASLRGQHVPSLRNVKIEARGDIVVLRGEVSSFYAKQLAQHSALRLAGDSRVVDEVSVVTPGSFRDPFRPRPAAAGAALLGIALAVGCSKVEPSRVAVHPVTGQVTLDGKAAAGAFVVFHSKAPESDFPAPRAQVDRQGSFALTTYRSRDGAPAGEYVVTVELRPIVAANGEFEPGPNILPPRYSHPQTSQIVVQVVAGENVVPIKIVR